MNKLLHERLREIAESVGCKGCEHLTSIVGSGCDEFDICTDCINAVTTALADEIEKYYIPRPRFENGEPVQFGDEVELHYKSGGCKKGCIQSWRVNEGTVRMLSFVGDDHELLYRYDSKIDVLKRSEHKVLDGDGEETNAGDTVYTKSGIKCTVEKIGTQQCEGMEDWDGTPWIMFDNGSWMHAHDVTHREPDSLEKLLVELRGVDFIPSKDYLNHLADRLAAIMERDA